MILLMMELLSLLRQSGIRFDWFEAHILKSLAADTVDTTEGGTINIEAGNNSRPSQRLITLGTPRALQVWLEANDQYKLIADSPEAMYKLLKPSVLSTLQQYAGLEGHGKAQIRGTLKRLTAQSQGKSEWKEGYFELNATELSSLSIMFMLQQHER